MLVIWVLRRQRWVQTCPWMASQSGIISDLCLPREKPVSKDVDTVPEDVQGCCSASMHMYMQIYLNSYMHTHTHVHRYTCTITHTHCFLTCTHTHTQIHLHSYMHTHTYTYTDNFCTHTDLTAPLHTHIYTTPLLAHTYTHIQIPQNLKPGRRMSISIHTYFHWGKKMRLYHIIKIT